VARRKLAVRIHGGEPYVFRDVRYLIDFITTVSDVSPGLAPFDCDPGVDSNASSDQHPLKRIGAMRANFLLADQPDGMAHATIFDDSGERWATKTGTAVVEQ